MDLSSTHGHKDGLKLIHAAQSMSLNSADDEYDDN
jgi:hypothetical protein